MNCPECGFEVTEDDIFCPNCSAMLKFDEVVESKEHEIEEIRKKEEADRAKREQEALKKAEEQKKKEQEAEKKKQLEAQKKAEAEKKRQYEAEKERKLAAKKAAEDKREKRIGNFLGVLFIAVGVLGVIAFVVGGVLAWFTDLDLLSSILQLVGEVIVAIYGLLLAILSFSNDEKGLGSLFAGVCIFSIGLFVFTLLVDLPLSLELEEMSREAANENSFVVQYQVQQENHTLAVLSNGMTARSSGNAGSVEIDAPSCSLNGKKLTLGLNQIRNSNDYDTASLQIEVGLYTVQESRSSCIWRKSFDKEGLKAGGSFDDLTFKTKIPNSVRSGQYYVGVAVKEYAIDRSYDDISDFYWFDEAVQFTNNNLKESSSAETLQVADVVKQDTHTVAKMSDGTFCLLNGTGTKITVENLSYGYDGKTLSVSYDAINNNSPWQTATLSCVLGLVKKDGSTSLNLGNTFQHRFTLGYLNEGYHYTENTKSVEIPDDLPAGEYYVTVSVDEQWLLDGWEKRYTKVFENTIRIGNFAL